MVLNPIDKNTYSLYKIPYIFGKRCLWHYYWFADLLIYNTFRIDLITV